MGTPVLSVLQIYGLAILLGALLGMERERGQDHMAGLRTFILVTLFGCICAQISKAASEPWIIPSGMAAIIVLAAAGHFTMVKEHSAPGLTTWVAMLVAFGIGALVGFDQTVEAVALSLATTIILYFKSILHNFSHSLSERDIYAIFQFGLIAFVILPVLPDRGFGPYKVLNPHNIWLMVVLVSAINLSGYLILKFGKKHWGGPMVGILGGTISSTATTLCFARRARENHGFSMMGAMIVALASTTVLVRMTLLIGIIHSELLQSLALPMTAMFLSGMIPVFFLWRKTRSQETPDPDTKNPAEITQALFFGVVYAVILLAVAAARDYLGSKGVYIVSLVSGLTDVDAITLSNARMAAGGSLLESLAAGSILIAFISNLGFKLAMVGTIGSRRMFNWTLVCFAFLALPALLLLI